MNGFLLISLLFTLRSETPNVTIEDFGGKADGITCNGPALMKAFAHAKEYPGTTLRLGGVCRVKTPQTMQGPFSMAAGATGVTNLTIQGGEIILGGDFGAFSFTDCPGLTLRDVVFDYDPPIHSQGDILSSIKTNRTMVVLPDPGYPSPADPDLFSNPDDTWLTVHKPGGEYGYFFVGYITNAIEGVNGQAILTHHRADLAQTLEGAEEWRYVRVRRGLGHLNVFTFCDDLRIEGCSFHAASAFVGLFVFCNDAVLKDNRICVRQNSRHMVSTCADGFHFIGGRRGPLIENNFFDRLQDDNIVISLRGNKIKWANGDQLELENASVAWYHAGDTIEVVEVETGTRREYTIVDMQPQIYHWAPPVMTLDRPLEGNIVLSDVNQPETLPTLVFNKSWRLDGTVIRNNVFQNTRRYPVFMGAGGVRIENNLMSNTTHGAVLCHHLLTLKNEYNHLIYYFSSDLTICSNTIVNAHNYGEGGRVFSRSLGAIDVNDRDRIVTGIGSLRLLRNISIQDNRIVNSGSAGIRISNALDVTLAGNEILDPNQQIQPDYYGILIEASDVTLSNNVFSGSNIVEEVYQVP
jgi:hypothetical protein